MKKLLLFTIYFISFAAFPQNWLWTKAVSGEGAGNEQLLAVNHKLYAYKSGPDGSYWNYDPTHDTYGSYLRTYADNGSLESEKHWAIPFHIRKLIGAKDSGFFFAGSFWGSRTIDSFTFSSAGKADGVFGKMKYNGQIEWLHTFGGSGNDFAYTLTYDKTRDILSVGGSTSDTVYIDHIESTQAKQSAIILQCNATGQISKYKLYDFSIAADSISPYSNGVVSLEHNGSGQLVMLMDRLGQYWYSYPYTHPIMGRYLVKLDQNLDTLWTKYIIGPSCYYGWQCTDLRMSANNDIYLAPTCGGHHSSSAHIQRYDGNTGALKWQFNYQDGSYPDIFVDSTTLYVIGNEGANLCACEVSNPGYYVVKAFDHNDNLQGESRVYNAYFWKLTGDGNGSLYVGGQFNQKVRIGPDTFQNNSGNARPFLSRLSTTFCSVPTVNTPPKNYPFMPDYAMCTGDSVQLQANNAAGTFSWSNGQTGPTAWVQQGGAYYLINHQPDGCTAYSPPVYVFENKQAQAPYPYLATFDAAKNRNTIIAGPGNYYEGDSHVISLYKLMHNGWMKVATASNASLYGFNALTDSTTDPADGPATYCFTSEDTCGNISAPGSSLTTVFLSAHRNTFTGGNELQWTSYKRMSRDYMLLRGDSWDHLQKIATFDTSQHVYVDYAEGSSFYQLVVETNTVQVPDGVYADAHSNIVQVLKTTSQEEVLPGNNVRVLPNPFSDALTLSFNAPAQMTSVKLINALGEVVLSENISETREVQINTSQQAKGLYTLELTSGDKKLRKKLIKQ